MDLAAFERTLSDEVPPALLSRPLQALWHAARGEWDSAHQLAQANEGEPAHDWVHAHLHRIEGDLGNAAYWYRRARRPIATGDLHEERRAIVAALLGQGGTGLAT
jgi:hypothetical protein